MSEESLRPEMAIQDAWKVPLRYRVSDIPPFYFTIFSALQQALLSIFASFAVTLVVRDIVCADQHPLIHAQLLASSMIVSGLCTLLQNTIGIRLPLFQGPTLEYVAPLIMLSKTSSWGCNVVESAMLNNRPTTNSTNLVYKNIATLQGSLMLAGFIQFVLGCTGLIGYILRFIGPITIIPTLFLVGIYIYRVSLKYSTTYWPAAILTAGIVIILSLYLRKRKMPLVYWNQRRKCHVKFYPLHVVFSMLVAILMGWLFCGILTVTSVLSDDITAKQYKARTDGKLSAVQNAEWLHLPYPGQYGTPGVTAFGMASFLVATITSIIDSIADYNACAEITESPSPPRFAINRGILVEGFCTFIAGIFGVAHGTTTFGGNIGTIEVTRDASRRCFQVVGVMYIIFGVLGKVGGILSTIPEPVVGGIQLLYFGSFLAVVLTYLGHLDLTSTRNMSIIGISILFGLLMPLWTRCQKEDLETGYPEIDIIIRAIVSNPNFAGGALACLLDNIVPGTSEERGILAFSVEKKKIPKELREEVENVYGIPFLPKRVLNSTWINYIPFLSPNYKVTENNQCCRRKNRVLESDA